MRDYLKFYIDGQWVDPIELRTLDVDNPTTEVVSGKIALGSAADVDRAVKAARKAFGTWSQSTRRSASTCCRRSWPSTRSAPDLADAVNEEMGAPPSLAAGPQVGMGLTWPPPWTC
jgi:aldehyde dehydrogenase (NAD+)